jgi:cell division inhibitor SepF
MGMWDKIKRSINPGEDDDNTYDDDEFEEDYSMGSYDAGVNDMPVSGNFSQQNPVYTQNTPNYNNYQPPISSSQPAASAPATSSVTSFTSGDAHAFEVKVIKPEVYSDGRRIADLLMARKTVIINFDETNKEIIRKLLDFMAGTAYAIKGDLQRVSEKTFIITPPNAKVSEERIKNTERGDIGRDNSIY